MSMDPVQLLLGIELDERLTTLNSLLIGLPDSIPASDSRYNFTGYAPSEDDKGLYGEEGALNHDLEVIFCPQSCQNGPIELTERGLGLRAVVGVLREFLKRFPASAILQKWVADLISAAKQSGAVNSLPIVMRSVKMCTHRLYTGTCRPGAGHD